jgi:hypothetical protein
MLMSEAEARNKWCPLLHDTCLASKCAYWRIVVKRRFETAQNESATKEEYAGPKPDYCAGWEFVPRNWGSSAGWLEPLKEACARAKGYCGMAGAPE